MSSRQSSSFRDISELSDDSEDYMVCNYVDRGVFGFSDSMIFGKDVKLLVSTGATINFIKKSALRDNVVFKNKATFTVVDVFGFELRTQGLVEISVKIGSQHYPIEFHVLGEGFSIPEAGILGSPFLSKFQVVMNIAQHKMIVLKPSKVPASKNDFSMLTIGQRNTPLKTYCCFKTI
ncbi:Aspartic peptidase domain [Cinara cedri]|uniref:Aspartic peptidase domain n=1 Tax=Cinara cedri TaxID=506608 RepID=A0A5E4NCX5_9HEMI|nr:Aspartic peptidase domain [Cinara cedri]